MKIIKIVNLLFFLLSVQSTSIRAEGKEQNIINFLSWSAISKETESKIYKFVEIDGFISFEGNGVYPKPKIWIDSESLRFKRSFRSIDVDVQSLFNVIHSKFEKNQETWESLQGCYIRIVGDFNDQDKGLDYITMGKIVNIQSLEISNNGAILLSLGRTTSK